MTTDTKPMSPAALRKLLDERDRFWRALHTISKYMPPRELQTKSERVYGLPPDEATDTTYAPEGWYEVIDNFDDCTFVAVSEGVITHWMPLPEAPDAIRAGAKETSDA